MDKQSFLEMSNERLMKIVTGKIRTTFIGGLSTFEQEFKDLIGKNSELWQQVRKKILDAGNNNIRAIEKEFRQYEINWTGEKHIFKVIGGKDEN